MNTLKQMETTYMNKTIELLQGIPYFNEWLTNRDAQKDEQLNKMQAELIKMQAEEHAKWIEAARKLKQLGLNNKSIVETTRLPLKEVKSLE
jgi:ribonucleotide reductase beta subunit family protein with ferritin-like domain